MDVILRMREPLLQKDIVTINETTFVLDSAIPVPEEHEPASTEDSHTSGHHHGHSHHSSHSKESAPPQTSPKAPAPTSSAPKASSTPPISTAAPAAAPGPVPVAAPALAVSSAPQDTSTTSTNVVKPATKSQPTASPVSSDEDVDPNRFSSAVGA